MQSEEWTRQPSARADSLQSPHQTHDAEEAEHIHLPPPSIWPVTMALGIALAAAGLVFTTLVSILGMLMMAWALFSWIQELRHEFH